MHGKIISKAENYGFIHCAKGVGHFFSNKMVGEGVSFEALEIGMPVSFEPVAGPKGMRAKQVTQRLVRYGWTAGDFLVLKGNAEIPIQQVEVLVPPTGQDERYLSAWAEFTVPIKDSRDQTLNSLIERVKACGANAIDRLKFETRTLRDGDAKGSYEVMTGRIANYRTSIEVESDDQYHQLVDEFYLLCEGVDPKIIDLQNQLDAELRDFQIHIPYFVGNTFLTLRQGEELHQDKALLCGVQLTTPWYRDFNAGKQELIQQAQLAGANCIIDMTRLEQTFSQGNYKYTMCSWTGNTGVWGRRKQVSDQQESDRLSAATQAHCEAVQARLVEVQSSLNMRREDQSFGSFIGGLGLFIVVIIVIVVFLAMFS